MSSVTGVFLLALSIQSRGGGRHKLPGFCDCSCNLVVEGEKLVVFVTLWYWENLTQVV